MTGDDPDAAPPAADGRRVVKIRTTHADAPLVAAALAPDNTDSMSVRVDGDAVACRIERSTTGGLRSTVDDYVVNLRVADRVAERGRTHETGETERDAAGETDADTTGETDAASIDTTTDIDETTDTDTNT